MKILTNLKKLSLLVTVLFAASCLNPETEYTNAIPTQTQFIVAFDFKSMAEKGGLNEANFKQYLDDIFDIARPDEERDDFAAFELMEKLIKSPRESGFALGDKVYFFVTRIGDDNKPILLAEIADVKKLKSNFEQLAKNDKCTPLVHKGGYYSTTFDGNSYCVFNETTFICGEVRSWDDKSVKPEIAKLLKQKRQNSLHSNPGFTKMLGQMTDLGFYVSVEGLDELYRGMLGEIIASSGMSMKDTGMIGNLDFRAGEVTMKFEYFTTNEDNLRIIAENTKYIKSPKNTFLNSIPANAFAYMNASFRGEDVIDMLAKREEFQDLQRSVEDKLDLVRLIKSFDGDMTMAVTGMSSYGNIPLFTMYSEVKDDYIMQLIAENIYEIGTPEKLRRIEKNKYIYTESDLKIYFGQEGNYLYATNDPNVVGNIAKAVENPLTKSQTITKLRNSNGYFIINVEEILKNSAVRMAIGFSGNRDLIKVMTLFEPVSQIEMVTNNSLEYQFNVLFKDKKRNPLHMIIHDIMMPLVKKEVAKSVRYRHYYDDVDVMESDEDYGDYDDYDVEEAAVEEVEED